MFCPLQARYALAKYNLLHTDWQNTTGKILISKTLQAKYFMGKILIGNILVGKVLGGNKRWAKYFVGNATGRQSTIDLNGNLFRNGIFMAVHLESEQ